MAKAPERTTIADAKPQSTTDDWMPLVDAFLHIQQVVGGEQLAKEELRLRLASGDVEAQDRLVTPGKGIEIIPLAPEDFKGPDSLFFWPVSELQDDLGPVVRHIGFLRRCSALVATTSSCAARTCTAYGRPVARMRGPLECRGGWTPQRSRRCCRRRR
jgi:hypothetical protein